MTDGTIQTHLPQPASDPRSSWGENPLFHLTRVCLVFLQELFRDPPEGANFRWMEDEEMTRLYLTDDSPVQSEVVEKRPCIATVRSGFAWAGLGLDQKRNHRIRTGEVVYTDMLSGNLTFNCMSKVPVEAEYLAWLVSRHIWIFKHLLMQQGFHKIGEGQQILARSPAGALVAGDTEHEICNVPVIVPAFFQWTERVQEKDLPLMDKVVTSINAKLGDVVRLNSTKPHLWGTAVGPRIEDKKRSGLHHPSMRGKRLVPVEPQPGGQPDPDGISITVIND